MRARAAIAMSLVLAACSTSSTAGTSPPPPTPPISATETPAQLPVSQLGFRCRLPVYGLGEVPDGFISFPTATYASAGTHGNYYFDVAVSRWVPVQRNAVSPDGRHYAVTEELGQTATRVHIVDAATGRDAHVVTMPEQS